MSVRALPQTECKISLATLAGNISLYFEKGVFVTLDGVSVQVCGMGGGRGDKEFSFICIRATEVPVKLVKCYCLGTDLSDFVYKHWAGCLEGRRSQHCLSPDLWKARGRLTFLLSFLSPLA